VVELIVFAAVLFAFIVAILMAAIRQIDRAKR